MCLQTLYIYEYKQMCVCGGCWKRKVRKYTYASWIGYIIELGVVKQQDVQFLS